MAKTTKIQCIFSLNKVIGASVDPDTFEYEKEYIDNNKTPGVAGKWSGFANYAKAKEDMQFYSSKCKYKFNSIGLI